MTGLSARRSSWMLTFADMLSILLCFLVLAYALKGAPDATREQALSAIRKVFRPGDSGQSGTQLQLTAPRGGNYWTTWLKVRVSKIPSLADSRIEVHGAKAVLALSGDTATGSAVSLADGDIAALAAVLNGSGAVVVIRAGAQSATAADWSDAGRRAQTLSDRLVAAGLRQTPRIIVSGAELPLAVEIGREEA